MLESVTGLEVLTNVVGLLVAEGVGIGNEVVSVAELETPESKVLLPAKAVTVLGKGADRQNQCRQRNRDQMDSLGTTESLVAAPITFLVLRDGGLVDWGDVGVPRDGDDIPGTVWKLEPTASASIELARRGGINVNDGESSTL